jgi:hypothetical protein
MKAPPPLHRRPAIRAAALAAAALAAIIITLTQTGDRHMSQIFAQPDPAVAAHDPFPTEIEKVERAWGEPIPDHLDRIGGVDEWGWAQIYRDTADPPGLFRGEYRNWRVRYKGTFRYVHRDGGPVPADVLSRYRMTSIDGTAVSFHEISDAPPVDYFELVPTDPALVERSPLAP